ncbi:MAG: acylphosphatase [Fimbriimonadaceae bacterium]|nr:acylphosphatase [Fimbriimonadaceae bacterium]
MFVQETALTLGCKGEVWNSRDGAVELVAEHDIEAILNDLTLRLRGGPGRVESVQDLGVVSGLSFEGFEIGPSR